MSLSLSRAFSRRAPKSMERFSYSLSLRCLAYFSSLLSPSSFLSQETEPHERFMMLVYTREMTRLHDIAESHTAQLLHSSRRRAHAHKREYLLSSLSLSRERAEHQTAASPFSQPVIYIYIFVVPKSHVIRNIKTFFWYCIMLQAGKAFCSTFMALYDIWKGQWAWNMSADDFPAYMSFHLSSSPLCLSSWRESYVIYIQEECVWWKPYTCHRDS